MIELIYKKRKNEKEWNRFFVKTKGNINSVDFCNPERNMDVEFVPITKKLYLLNFLFFNIPKGISISKVTFQAVLDAIPQEISKDVAAVEIFSIFNVDDIWRMTMFNEEKRDTSIFWVSLLTEKNTGKELIPVRPTPKDIPKDIPIGISDEEWQRILREFSLK